MDIPLIQIESTDSSSRYALGLAAQGQRSAPFAVLAATQTAGQGQVGKTWKSPPGNLYLSVVLPVATLASSQTALLPLWVAVLLASWFERHVKLRVSLKWPNDVFVGGKKLAGVLCQVTSQGQAKHDLVLGIGINVSNAPHLEGGAYPSTCLNQLGYHNDTPLTLARSLLVALGDEWSRPFASTQLLTKYKDFALADGFLWSEGCLSMGKLYQSVGFDKHGRMKLKALPDHGRLEHGSIDEDEIHVSSANHPYNPYYFSSTPRAILVFAQNDQHIEIAACVSLEWSRPIQSYRWPVLQDANRTRMGLQTFLRRVFETLQMSALRLPVYYCAETRSKAGMDAAIAALQSLGYHLVGSIQEDPGLERLCWL